MAKISFLVFWANLVVIFRGEGVKISKNRWNSHVREFSLLSESKIGFPIARTVVELLTVFYTLPPKMDFFLVFWANLVVIFRGEGVKIWKNRWNCHVREFSLLSESKIGFPIPRTVVELLTIFYTLPPKSGFLDFRIINANLCKNQIFPRHAVFGKS